MAISRRLFVSGTTGCAAAIGCGVGASGCGNTVSAAPLAEVSVDAKGSARLTVAQFPDLTPIGGALTVQLTGVSAGTHSFSVPETGCLLIHRGPVGDPDEFVCVQSFCPHAGCP